MRDVFAMLRSRLNRRFKTRCDARRRHREVIVTVEAGEDQWATWLAHRRHGGDPEQLRRALEFLAPIRAEVIAHAALTSGDTCWMWAVGTG